MSLERSIDFILFHGFKIYSFYNENVEMFHKCDFYTKMNTNEVKLIHNLGWKDLTKRCLFVLIHIWVKQLALRIISSLPKELLKVESTLTFSKHSTKYRILFLNEMNVLVFFFLILHLFKNLKLCNIFVSQFLFY